MASDYNANLIVELYAAQDPEQATRISDEMVEIGDPVFPRQIYEIYKRFKDTPYSHYFAHDLTRFSTSDAAEALKQIALNSDRWADLSMIMDYLSTIGFFDSNVVRKIRDRLTHEIYSGEVNQFDIAKYVQFIEKSGVPIAEIGDHLKFCFEDDRQDIKARRIALNLFLKIDPKQHIGFYYTEYESIKGKKAEAIFAKEISTWQGGIVPELFSKILKNGSEVAKEIIIKAKAQKESEDRTKESREQKEVKEEYQTADVIADIAELRIKVNKITSNDERFGFPFFIKSEEIYLQGKPAKDKASLIGYCMALRPLLGGFDEKISEFELTENRALELLPELKDFKGSINRFHLFLLSGGLNVDLGLFGLRNLNRIITKFAAHTNEENSEELVALLKEEGLFDDYQNDNWSRLHRKILEKYKSFLEKVVSVVNSTQN